MLHDADTNTDAGTPDSSPVPAKAADEITDNNTMTTTMFTAERALDIEPTDVAEATALSYTLKDSGHLEDTLVEPPVEIQEVLNLSEPADKISLPAEEVVAELSLPIAEEPEETSAEVAPVGPPEIVVCSQTNGRTNNEDSYFIQALPTMVGAPPVLLLALSDGMGGHDFGEHASRETLRKLALLLFEQYAVMPRLNGGGGTPTVEELGRAMVQAIPIVSGHVQRIAEINGWNRSGATLVAGVIVGDTAVFANVGDSPACHIRPRRNHIANLTDDHSLAGMLLKANLITTEMARVHEGRCQLEHYIGGPNLPNDLPLRMVTLKPGDYVLLCSDGVSNALTDEVTLRLLSEGETLSDKAVGFVVHARQEGEHDNQTIVLYRHGDTPSVPELIVVPDAGPAAAQPTDFSDNEPATKPADEVLTETRA